jgi:hypothetical protein
MEALEDLIEQLEKFQNKYSAVFDVSTGKVISVGPSVAFIDEKNKIEIESDIAEDIITAKINIANCFVDISSGSFEITEIKSIRKIDDVLHRISLKKFSDIENPDLFVTYFSKRKEMKFELSTDLGGTKKSKKTNRRKIHWGGDTVMDFYITKYNDPHWILYHFDVIIDELEGKSKIYKNLDLPEKFSVFTRRILKNYVLEIK